MLWLDAHPDFNTPETRISGIRAGKPVAILAGLAGPNWRGAAGLAAPVPAAVLGRGPTVTVGVSAAPVPAASPAVTLVAPGTDTVGASAAPVPAASPAVTWTFGAAVSTARSRALSTWSRPPQSQRPALPRA